MNAATSLIITDQITGENVATITVSEYKSAAEAGAAAYEAGSAHVNATGHEVLTARA